MDGHLNPVLMVMVMLMVVLTAAGAVRSMIMMMVMMMLHRYPPHVPMISLRISGSIPSRAEAHRISPSTPKLRREDTT